MAKPKQTTDTVFMVSPDHFGFNEQTAYTNPFQVKSKPDKDITVSAQDEFDKMIIKLIDVGVNVIHTRSVPDLYTPDSVFPCSWFSTHKRRKDTVLVLYPLHTQNRRDERQVDILRSELLKSDIKISKIYDLTKYELQGKALEGTGSVAFDHINKIAYATLSQRANGEVFRQLCKILGYRPYLIYTASLNGFPVSHTSTILSIEEHYTLFCPKAIQNNEERKKLKESLKRSNRTIMEITLEQAKGMSAYILELKTKKKEPVVVMSSSVRKSFGEAQLKVFEKIADIVEVKIPIIEKIGGTSAKSMMAEIFY
jgi:hypothetical protein